MKKILFFSALVVLFSCNTKPPSSNSDHDLIVGKKIKLENIEIAEFDFPIPVTWPDARNLCSSLGEGWRLPSKDELTLIYNNFHKVPNLKFEVYWNGYEDYAQYSGYAYTHDFYNGKFGFQYQREKANVRAVRSTNE